MILKKFSIQIFVRIIAITITSFIFVLNLKNLNHFFSISFFAILIIVQVLFLIRYVNQINHDLIQFYNTILNEDSTSILNLKRKSHEPELMDTLNQISDQFSQIRYEREVNYSYLKQLVNHLKTGIIAYRTDGTIDLINHSALTILGLPKINSLHELKRFGDDFYKCVTNPSVTGNESVELNAADRKIMLSLRSSMFRLDDKTIQILSFHEINKELETTELKSWEKLIRVITHEIMNSVGPIISLTKTMRNIFKDHGTPKFAEKLEDKHVYDTLKGLDIIQRRGNGLMDFIKAVRQVHLIPQPLKEEVLVKDLFDGVIRLMNHNLKEYRVEYKLKMPFESLTLYCDRNLIEQVLINLVKNSVDSIKEKDCNGHIELSAYPTDEGKMIQVKDNGEGIDQTIKEEVFIPFYSTKDKGSGIGLSLSRQIMRYHGGSIWFYPGQPEGTIFTLLFHE